MFNEKYIRVIVLEYFPKTKCYQVTDVKRSMIL